MDRRSKSQQGHVLYMGLMMKRGGLRKNWNLRWFEITKTHLIYFKFAKDTSDTDYSAKVKGVIKLSECLNVYRGKESIARNTGVSVHWPDSRYPPSRDSKSTLALKTKRRTYYMVAQTRDAAKQWESILRQSCSEFKPSFSSGSVKAQSSFLRDTSKPYDRRMTMSKMGVQETLMALDEETTEGAHNATNDGERPAESDTTGGEEEDEMEFLDADSMDEDDDDTQRRWQ
ncbi:hypothetical protein PTSG_05824 [Salpingoeca rosetta]|uniref:PH domain-containing protein n=1 Tax=Salpingoeca rosetta (strain ATCC 50818 / BSB-021) TaxID=946362 RepID=F2UCW5_SALR5|nr:uncharacterized protein PTSG_05824 [Salpingoeca rosetta]EGD74460.1 hypothetical protein PTSG_05824 [Salpingoeca rosetta]|eukprot:XP_004992717.1 hypothetical protein PTSG_05824 [Salpingoeca rosetta]